MSIHRFSFPTTIHFGAGARASIAKHLETAGVRRPLVVTDQGIASLPICHELVGSLKSANLSPTLFAGIFGNPTKSQVSAGVAAFNASGSDGIVGFGGGAALDVAKAIALMIHHPGDLFDYEDDKPGALPIDRPIPYWIAVPTTSGTGSEVGRSAVVSDDVSHVKKIIFSPRLIAQCVFADPELTLALPPPVTASTGLDALTHCVEAYLAKGYHPICDGIALEGLRLAARSLAKATRSPDDLDARSDMMMASMMGAIAFQKGLGVTHSCAHALGTVCDMHHGLANGIMIDFALKHNAAAVDERFRAMAHTIGLGETSAEGFLAWLKTLKEDCNVPVDLKAAGIGADTLDALVDIAIADGCHANNPVPCTKEDFRRIFSEALG